MKAHSLEYGCRRKSVFVCFSLCVNSQALQNVNLLQEREQK